MRSYHQFCPAARTLDLVGERWTLLIVRELLRGPKRYTDLQSGLPGVGPTMLAGRLRELEAAGLVERVAMPAPAASTVYRLTSLGDELRGLMAQLYRFGIRLLDSPAAGDSFRAAWLLGALEAAGNVGALPADTTDVYEFHVGGEVVCVTVDAGRLQVSEGEAPAPDLVVRCDPRTLLGLGTGRAALADAVERGELMVEGEHEAALRCAALFGFLTGEPIHATRSEVNSVR